MSDKEPKIKDPYERLISHAVIEGVKRLQSEESEDNHVSYLTRVDDFPVLLKVLTRMFWPMLEARRAIMVETEPYKLVRAYAFLLPGKMCISAFCYPNDIDSFQGKEICRQLSEVRPGGHLALFPIHEAEEK